jgi:hypothetical protein
MVVTDPVGGFDVQFDRACVKGIADGYASILKIGSLVGVAVTGMMDRKALPRFSRELTMVEIAKLPDKLQ